MAKKNIGHQNDSAVRGMAEYYKGAVPPPAMLKSFYDVNSSFPERIFKMAEDAGDRQLKQLENQKLQIESEARNRQLEIETTERLNAMEIKSRNRDLFFKNVIALIGLFVCAATCAALLYMSYTLLMSDKSGYALATASPVIGVALVAAIKLLKK
ncbi:MAG: hypothetical protein J6W54_12740 [Fibrobacter sp.]|nr:hypothetical protein [Fibrobacter sp.]